MEIIFYNTCYPLSAWTNAGQPDGYVNAYTIINGHRIYGDRQLTVLGAIASLIKKVSL